MPDLRFVWFDSQADFYGDEEESSATGMQKVLAQMRRISAELGCTVITSGHTGHGPRDGDGDELPMERQRGSSRFRQAWDFEIQATGTALVVKKEREAARLPPVPYRMVPRLDSLAVAAGTAEGPGEPVWPYPVTGDQVDRVVAAVTGTPGMSMSAVARAAKVRKEDAHRPHLGEDGMPWLDQEYGSPMTLTDHIEAATGVRLGDASLWEAHRGQRRPLAQPQRPAAFGDPDAIPLPFPAHTAVTAAALAAQAGITTPADAAAQRAAWVAENARQTARLRPPRHPDYAEFSNPARRDTGLAAFGEPPWNGSLQAYSAGAR